MEVNYSKFACYCHNINMDLFTTLDTFFSFEKMELGEGVKYLRYYVKPNKYLKHDWFLLISRVES